MTKQCIKVKNC